MVCFQYGQIHLICGHMFASSKCLNSLMRAIVCSDVQCMCVHASVYECVFLCTYSRRMFASLWLYRVS